MNENILSRILTGEASDDDKKLFYSYLKDNKEEEKLFYELKSLWVKASMNTTKVNADEEFDRLWKRVARPKRNITHFISNRILRYAAFLVLFFTLGGMAGYFITKNTMEMPGSGLQKFTAMKGSVSIIELSDGTKVWLNSGTQLTYREDFKNNQRLAELSGEAYFEVKHRDDCPLLVTANQIVVRDLGTTFNIKAYPDDQTVETSLVEGKADISSLKGVKLLDLNPGESAVYSTIEKKIAVRSISENVLSAWREGKFVIRDQRLEDIFMEISRWYNVEFEFKNDALREYRFTGNIKKTTTAVHVLKMLKMTADFNYQIIENADQPDRIIIY